MHTPGPWRIVPPGGPQGPFHGLLGGQGYVVATQIVGEADARLCAAAPDLLAALIRADSYLSLLRHRADVAWGSIGLPTEYETDRVIGQARTAIAKATGADQ